MQLWWSKIAVNFGMFQISYDILIKMIFKKGSKGLSFFIELNSKNIQLIQLIIQMCAIIILNIDFIGIIDFGFRGRGYTDEKSEKFYKK